MHLLTRIFSRSPFTRLPLFGRLKPESRLLLLFGLLFGGLAWIVVPPIITYDGPGHFYRALQIQNGQFRAERFSPSGLGGDFPERYVEFVNRLWSTYWAPPPLGTIGPKAMWQDVSDHAEQLHGRCRVDFANIANYAPLSYTFQSTGAGLAGLVSRSPLLVHRVACLFNLGGYLLLAMLALELAPRFERGLLLIASSPLIIVQAASVSADATNFALPLLLVAWVWRLRAEPTPCAPSALLGPLALGLALALLKPTAIVLLACLVLIPTRHFGTMRRKVLRLGGHGLAAFGLWWFWNQPYLDLEIAQWVDPSHPSAGLLKAWQREHPLEGLPPLTHAFSHDLWAQWPTFFGRVGGWVWPGFEAYLGTFSALFFIGYFGCGGWRGPVDRRWAGGMVLISLAVFALISLVLWLTFGTIGSTIAPFMSGRYLFPVYLGFGIAFAELSHGLAPERRNSFFWLGLGANAVWLSLILGSTAQRVWA